MRVQIKSLAGVVALALLLGSPAWADPDGRGERAFAVTERVQGKTYPQWARAFFQWAYGIRKDRNPITDQTGEFAAEGQAGPVWFLAGNLGGKTVRKVSIPANKPVFFPIVYSFPHPDTVTDDEAMQLRAKALADRVTEMEAGLDNRPIEDVKQYRVATGTFLLTFPARRSQTVHPALVGTQKLAANGYWIMLRPLPAGDHTLRIKGKVGPADAPLYEEDITYHMAIKSE
jgi:hypothetical protein